MLRKNSINFYENLIEHSYTRFFGLIAMQRGSSVVKSWVPLELHLPLIELMNAHKEFHKNLYIVALRVLTLPPMLKHTEARVRDSLFIPSSHFTANVETHRGPGLRFAVHSGFSLISQCSRRGRVRDSLLFLSSHL